MKSILENRPELYKEVYKVAEVAGYLWQKGWAERNGGNITVNITEYVDDEMKNHILNNFKNCILFLWCAPICGGL